MKKYTILIMALALLVLSFASSAPQNGYDLFQKALAKERGEGNLEEAISIWTMDVKEGKPKLVTKRLDGWDICWSPDGKDIIFEKRTKGMEFELYKVPAEGGEPEKMNIKGRSAEYSPEGKKIAFSRCVANILEFWIVENFLPEVKGPKKSKER